jgi:hypothetical protein
MDHSCVSNIMSPLAMVSAVSSVFTMPQMMTRRATTGNQGVVGVPVSNRVDIDVPCFDIEDSSILYWIDIECYNLQYVYQILSIRYRIPNIRYRIVTCNIVSPYRRSFADLQYQSLERFHLQYRDITISKVRPSISKVRARFQIGCCQSRSR